MNKPGKPINISKPKPRPKPGEKVMKPLPVKPKPDGGVMKPLPVKPGIGKPGTKEQRQKQIKTLQDQMMKAKKKK